MERGRMIPNESTRTARLEARVAPEVLALVRRAAEIQEGSVSDFVVAAAQRTIEETQILRLSVEDQRRFAEARLSPDPLTPAVERYRALIEPAQ
jgi:uncharacterized protein (DUF1778 family)